MATDIPEFTTTQQHTGSNQVYNKEGIPQLKPGKVAWNFVDWNHSKTNSETMYNTDYVNSGLITGTQWDVMLQKITSSDPTKSLTSSNWGNYYDQQLTYTGRSAKATNTNNVWYQEKLGGYVKNATKAASSSSSPCYVLSTGASEQAKAYNLYDVAGNLWEWTEESSTYQTSNQYRVVRGGSFIYALATDPACYRDGNVVTYTYFDVGFRPVLYIK